MPLLLAVNKTWPQPDQHSGVVDLSQRLRQFESTRPVSLLRVRPKRSFHRLFERPADLVLTKDPLAIDVLQHIFAMGARWFLAEQGQQRGGSVVFLRAHGSESAVPPSHSIDEAALLKAICIRGAITIVDRSTMDVGQGWSGYRLA
jgi:hypothetical protein